MTHIEPSASRYSLQANDAFELDKFIGHAIRIVSNGFVIYNLCQV